MASFSARKRHGTLVGIGALLALTPALLLFPVLAWSGDWSLEGDLGVEVESVSESFSVPDTIPITVIGTPGTPVEEQFESVRFRDRDTLTDGLLRLRLFHVGSSTNLGLRGRFTTGSGRSRGTFEVEADHRTSNGNRMRLFDYFYGQSGGGESQEGFQNEMSLSWEPPWLGRDWDLRWRGRWDLSQSSGDSTSRIFNYNRARGEMRVSRSWGWGKEVALEGRWSGKWMDEGGPGSYRSGEGRLEVDWGLGSETPVSASYEVERRSYVGSESLTDSYWDHTINSRVTTELSRDWSLESVWVFRQTDYDTTGTIFFDNRVLVGSILARLQLGGNWSIKLGPGMAWLATLDDVGFGSYKAGHLHAELAYEPLGGTWFHATGRVGRRDYGGDPEGASLVFEGYNLSLTSSDFDFVSAGILGEAKIGWGLTMELFLQYDVELHDIEDDDFTLSLLTLRVSRAL